MYRLVVVVVSCGWLAGCGGDDVCLEGDVHVASVPNEDLTHLDEAWTVRGETVEWADCVLREGETCEWSAGDPWEAPTIYPLEDGGLDIIFRSETETVRFLGDVVACGGT